MSWLLLYLEISTLTDHLRSLGVFTEANPAVDVQAEENLFGFTLW
jgi:hypothetical protein